MKAGCGGLYLVVAVAWWADIGRISQIHDLEDSLEQHCKTPDSREIKKKEHIKMLEDI